MDDPARPAASRPPELLILAPAEDTDEVSAFAAQCGARWMPLSGAADAPAVLRSLLG